MSVERMLSKFTWLSTIFSKGLVRSNYSVRKLYTMKLPEHQMKHILRPGVSSLSDLFIRNGFEIRLAGGAVRDLLMDQVPTDLDFATTATPDEMKKMFEKEEVRVRNKAGDKHGTVTAYIAEENFECTTLRIDKVTDGRHAEVEFTRDWELDARRRDFTINTLFLGLDGTIYDYMNGVEHLKNKIVTFVGDPDKRIQEDYLRILRYFRFYGRVANDPSEHDPVILDSIQRNHEGLAKISGERIWVEVKKIVVGRFGIELLLKMIECGIGIHIGLSKEFNHENMNKVYNHLRSAGLENSDFHPCTLLASGFVSEDDAQHFIKRVRFSNKEKDILLLTIKNRELFSDIKSIKMIQDFLVDMVYKDKKRKDLALLVVTELIKYAARVDLLNEINIDLIPHFPVKGGMLVDKIKRKNQIQVEMRRLLDVWKESNYSLGSEELLNEIKR